MSKKTPIPDAWDDDWESQADKADATAAVEEAAKTTKAERLALHAETNKKIWDQAQKPDDDFPFLLPKDNIPFKQEFKPALKILSRKPAPKVVERKDPLTGLVKLTLEDEGEEEEVKVRESVEEMKERTARERREKQRLYDEAKARIFTTGSGSGNSTPGAITPPTTEGPRGNEGGRGKGRAGGGARRPESQSGVKELFDPNYTPKMKIQRRGSGKGTGSGRSTPREEEQIIRAPRGPDSSGRGGFASRGGTKS